VGAAARRSSRATCCWRCCPWFLLSLLLLVLGTFFVLRRSVLDPLEELARAAQRVKAGDLSARLREPERADEIGQLFRSFNEMTANVQGFNARLGQEVETATAQARRAEAAALTQRRLAAMGELAAGIAHEINNPLGGLLNAVESLERGKLPPAEARALLRAPARRPGAHPGHGRAPAALHAAHGAGRPGLAGALARGRARAGRATARARWASSCSSRPRTGRDARGVLARWRALPPVVGERGELAQAVLNLLVNALDALEDDGRPGGGSSSRSSAAADELLIPRARRRPGVPPENLPRVADLFFTTKEVGRGTGLGLSIVHQVVAAHGGRVFLSNGAGGGFQVEIHLPLSRSAPAHELPARMAGAAVLLGASAFCSGTETALFALDARAARARRERVRPPAARPAGAAGDAAAAQPGGQHPLLRRGLEPGARGRELHAPRLGRAGALRGGLPGRDPAQGAGAAPRAADRALERAGVETLVLLCRRRCGAWCSSCCSSRCARWATSRARSRRSRPIRWPRCSSRAPATA
jgi:signal transduction histidine kinase